MTDDDPAIRRYLARDLPSLGFIVLGIDPDQLAVERLQQLRPDAIVVGTDALTESDRRLLRLVRGASQVPALVLLGNESPNLIIEALDLGASDCLSKPFLLGELAARLRKTLRQALSGPDVRGTPSAPVISSSTSCAASHVCGARTSL